MECSLWTGVLGRGTPLSMVLPLSSARDGKLGSLSKRGDYLRNPTHFIVGMFLRFRPLDKQCLALFVVLSASCVLEG